MIAEVIVGVFILVIAFVLIRALVSGRIEFNAAGKGMAADRSKEPGAFWTVFLIGLLVIAYFVWLLLP